jgi:hypothetical protein
MPVVHVAHGGHAASICVRTGVAVVPEMGCYKFWYVSNGNVRSFNNESVLPGLPWGQCIHVEKLQETDLIIILMNDQGMPVFLQFKNMSGFRLNMESKVTILQGYLRRVVCECNERQERLEVAALALHPRVGAKSPITVEILCMVKEIFLGRLRKKPSSH